MLDIKTCNIFHSTYASTNIASLIDTEKLYTECLNYKSLHPGRTLSNSGGYQSNDLLYTEMSKKYSEYTKLVDTISNILDSVSTSIGAEKLIIDNIWININYKNNFNWSHAHPRSILSGAFYVKVPKEDNNSFVFERDQVYYQSEYSMWIDTANSNSKKDNRECSITTHTGDFLLFPSYLQHKVKPNTTDSDRVSIAFNTSMVS